MHGGHHAAGGPQAAEGSYSEDLLDFIAPLDSWAQNLNLTSTAHAHQVKSPLTKLQQGQSRSMVRDIYDTTRLGYHEQLLHQQQQLQQEQQRATAEMIQKELEIMEQQLRLYDEQKEKEMAVLQTELQAVEEKERHLKEQTEALAKEEKLMPPSKMMRKAGRGRRSAGDQANQNLSVKTYEKHKKATDDLVKKQQEELDRLAAELGYMHPDPSLKTQPFMGRPTYTDEQRTLLMQAQNNELQRAQEAKIKVEIEELLDERERQEELEKEKKEVPALINKSKPIHLDRFSGLKHVYEPYKVPSGSEDEQVERIVAFILNTVSEIDDPCDLGLVLTEATKEFSRCFPEKPVEYSTVPNKEARELMKKVVQLKQDRREEELKSIVYRDIADAKQAEERAKLKRDEEIARKKKRERHRKELSKLQRELEIMEKREREEIKRQACQMFENQQKEKEKEARKREKEVQAKKKDLERKQQQEERKLKKQQELEEKRDKQMLEQMQRELEKEKRELELEKQRTERQKENNEMIIALEKKKYEEHLRKEEEKAKAFLEREKEKSKQRLEKEAKKRREQQEKELKKKEMERQIEELKRLKEEQRKQNEIEKKRAKEEIQKIRAEKQQLAAKLKAKKSQDLAMLETEMRNQLLAEEVQRAEHLAALSEKRNRQLIEELQRAEKEQSAPQVEANKVQDHAVFAGEFQRAEEQPSAARVEAKTSQGHVVLETQKSNRLLAEEPLRARKQTSPGRVRAKQGHVVSETQKSTQLLAEEPLRARKQTSPGRVRAKQGHVVLEIEKSHRLLAEEPQRTRKQTSPGRVRAKQGDAMLDIEKSNRLLAEEPQRARKQTSPGRVSAKKLPNPVLLEPDMRKQLLVEQLQSRAKYAMVEKAQISVRRKAQASQQITLMEAQIRNHLLSRGEVPRSSLREVVCIAEGKTSEKVPKVAAKEEQKPKPIPIEILMEPLRDTNVAEGKKMDFSTTEFDLASNKKSESKSKARTMKAAAKSEDKKQDAAKEMIQEREVILSAKAVFASGVKNFMDAERNSLDSVVTPATRPVLVNSVEELPAPKEKIKEKRGAAKARAEEKNEAKAEILPRFKKVMKAAAKSDQRQKENQPPAENFCGFNSDISSSKTCRQNEEPKAIEDKAQVKKMPKIPKQPAKPQMFVSEAAPTAETKFKSKRKPKLATKDMNGLMVQKKLPKQPAKQIGNSSITSNFPLSFGNYGRVELAVARKKRQLPDSMDHDKAVPPKKIKELSLVAQPIAEPKFPPIIQPQFDKKYATKSRPPTKNLKVDLHRQCPQDVVWSGADVPNQANPTLLREDQLPANKTSKKATEPSISGQKTAEPISFNQYISLAEDASKSKPDISSQSSPLSQFSTPNVKDFHMLPPKRQAKKATKASCSSVEEDLELTRQSAHVNDPPKRQAKKAIPPTQEQQAVPDDRTTHPGKNSQTPKPAVQSTGPVQTDDLSSQPKIKAEIPESNLFATSSGPRQMEDVAIVGMITCGNADAMDKETRFI